MAIHSNYKYKLTLRKAVFFYEPICFMHSCQIDDLYITL